MIPMNLCCAIRSPTLPLRMTLQIVSPEKLLLALLTFKLEVCPVRPKMSSQIFQPDKGLAALSAAMRPCGAMPDHVSLVMPPHAEHFTALAAMIHGLGLRAICVPSKKHN